MASYARSVAPANICKIIRLLEGYECLKFGGHVLYECICKLFNAIVAAMYIPDQLKQRLIIPFYNCKNKPKDFAHQARENRHPGQTVAAF